MDRQGPLGPKLILLILLVGAASSSRAEEPAEAIENRPYRIALHLASDPAARLDAGRSDDLIARWRELVRRFIGPSWDVQLAEKPSPLVGVGLERLKAEDLAGFAPNSDKAWLVWIAPDAGGAGYVFTGREYDSAARWLGPLQRRECSTPLDAARAFFLFSRDLFSPSALVVGQEGGRALLKVQGAAIPAASELGAVVAKGTTFVPLRLVTMRDDSVRISRIAYTYLAAESVEGSIARCLIVSAYRDPLSNRVSRPNSLAALGIKAGDSSLHFRFVDRATKAPAAGYTLTERTAPDGPVREVGMTDRSGRIVVEPGVNRSVVKLRLLAGDSEPLAEFPMMPGEGVEEREIPIDPLPLASKYQVQLDALRDAIVDQVALRGRLERLMQSRLEGEDWDGLQGLLKEYDGLPSPAGFTESVKKLKDEATKLSYETTKTTVLTRHLQAEFDELQGLVDGYLGTDASVAFADALKNGRKEQDEKAKAAKKPAPLSAPIPPPPGEVGPAAAKAEEQPGAPRADVP